LDLLWGVTEAEGTFDAVKANVYDMIQDLAAHLDTVRVPHVHAVAICYRVGVERWQV
jgi:hypothetical protein